MISVRVRDSGVDALAALVEEAGCGHTRL